MPRYHLNFKGEASICRAKKNCPFGDLDTEHYSSPEEARKAYEKIAKNNLSVFPQYVNYNPEQVAEDAKGIDDLEFSLEYRNSFQSENTSLDMNEVINKMFRISKEYNSVKLDSYLKEIFPKLSSEQEMQLFDSMSSFDSVYSLRLIAANSSRNSQKNLDELGKDFNHPQIILAVVKNRQTPASTLSRIFYSKVASNQDSTILEEMAKNDNCPSDILQRLSKSTLKRIRLGVAENVNTPERTINRLYKDKNLTVSVSSVRNPNISQRILKKASLSSEFNYRLAAAENPNNHPENLNILSESKDFGVVDAVSRNSSTSVAALEKLSQHPNKIIRLNVAKNPHTSLLNLRRLMEDSDPETAKTARERFDHEYSIDSNHNL